MAEQSPDYQRGYAAGRRRENREERDRERDHAMLLARYQLAAAIAPEIVRNPWQTDGVRHTSAKQIAGTVAELVKEIERRL